MCSSDLNPKPQTPNPKPQTPNPKPLALFKCQSSYLFTMSANIKSQRKSTFRITGFDKINISDRKSSQKGHSDSQRKINSHKRTDTSGPISGNLTGTKHSNFRSFKSEVANTYAMASTGQQDTTTDISKRQLARLDLSARLLREDDRIKILDEQCAKILQPIKNPESTKKLHEVTPNKKLKICLAKDSLKYLIIN